ncbi:MAG: SGNH/GDSL hydrolase family protein [Ruminococcaceae bacterium]|nr:SGNH/GDSL hydrolase family protein [Oscillospiraceae bacterium]
MKKRIFVAVSAILVICVLLTFLGALVIPKYTDNKEGALVGEYYAEAGGHDVLFIGDCEVYESIVPAVLWEKYGINSYVRGSAQQLVWQSYYLLEDTLRYEKPKAVVYNVMALKYGEPQREEYNRMTIDGMKWSSSKVGAINASMTEEESFVEYVFPLLRFHSRITALTADDLKYAFETPKVSHNGYLMQTGIVPRTDFSEGFSEDDYIFSENAIKYLDMMREKCEDNGIEFILMKAPTNLWRYWWHDEWETQVVEYADKYDLKYYNFIPLEKEIGIDWNTDTYDKGAHLNVYGAEKFTEYFGAILADEFSLPDRRADTALSEAWDVRLEKYYYERNNGGK